MKLKLIERIECIGHTNILGTHKSTLELTKDSHLTKKGDCILGVNSNKSCSDLKDSTKELLKNDLKFLIKLRSNNISDEFYGFGSQELVLTHKEDIVFRKSNFICPRTIMISCSKSAKEVDRNLIEILKHKGNKLEVEIYLEEKD